MPKISDLTSVVSVGTADTIPVVQSGTTKKATFLQMIASVFTNAGSNILALVNGGTGSSTAAGARTNLGAAASGANSDITSLSALSTPLSVAQGGTGVTTSTGTGATVRGTSPTLTTPTMTAPSVDSLNGGQLAGTRNKIINGNMAIDQRNAGAAQTITAAAALAYCVDRFYAYCTGANVTGQQVAGTAPNKYNYRFTGAASVTKIGFAQRIEAANSQDLAGTTATLSVDLANSLLTTVTWTAWYANTADTFGTLASPTRTQIATGTFTVNSTLTRYNTNINIPVAATTGVEIELSVGAQTSGTWTIGRVQLEAGSTATSFEYRSYGLELLLCHRYFWFHSNSFITTSSYVSALTFFTDIYMSTPMRVAGTVSLTNIANTLCSSASVNNITPNRIRITSITSGTGVAYSTFDMAVTSEL